VILLFAVLSIGSPLTERREIMNKHINDTSTTEGDFYNQGSETFKATEMKGTIKLEPEDVKLDEDNDCPGCKYAIDLSKRLVNELGRDWAEHWEVAETNLTPHEEFYNIDVILKRRKI